MANHDEFDKELSALFFNLNLNAPLKKLTETPDIKLTYNPQVLKDVSRVYEADFLHHPQIKEKIVSGTYSIKLDHEDLDDGISMAFLEIEFESEKALKAEFERLTRKFMKISGNTVISPIEKTGLFPTKIITFSRNESSKIPSLTFTYETSYLSGYVLDVALINQSEK